MAQNDDQDKSEQATPYKLEQARKKGQVAKSMEVSALVTLTAFTLITIAMMPSLQEKLGDLIEFLLAGSGAISVTPGTMIELFVISMMDILTAFSPIIVGVVLLGIIITMMQTKPVFTTEPLKPNFSKLNPVEGLKKLFSIKVLFELVKTCLKLTAIASLIYFGLSWVMTDLIGSRFIAGYAIGDYWFEMFKKLAMAMILVLLPFALIDLLFSKKEFAKKMRMSKREVKEEIKRRDGDPDVRAKRKKIQSELLKKTAAISNVKDSDVILTNPTHFAVALKYVPKKMIAPIVVAKGSDLIADKIKRVALEHNIPILRQPALARKIFKETEIEQPILESNYEKMAPIFRWVFELRREKF